LQLRSYTAVLSKGMAVDEDSYSGFEAVDSRGLALGEVLRQSGIDRIYVGGLATDYCVKQTVLDGLAQGFQVVLLQDGVAGVNLHPEDSDQAVEAMVKAGVTVGGSVDTFRIE
jgi:nicotinamidase/pyrazinamidase